MSSSYIPAMHIKGANLPEAWEKALVWVWENGVDIRTEYDKKNDKGEYIDPPSKDATVMVEVADPFSEPRIHKNFPGGPQELEVYRQEVVDGIHDHWIDPENDKWTYTYHERLFKYAVTADLDRSDAPRPFKAVNQIQYIIDKLAETGHTRRAQAVTWMPTADPQTYDPPCLQRVWCRILEEKGRGLVLNMNTHWRSRDLYKAWFMNVYALTDLQRIIAAAVSKRIGKPVAVGRYVDIADSLHIYGSYFKDFKPEYEKMKKTPDYRDRAWGSDHPAFVMMVDETRAKLKENVDFILGGQ
ncbi:MAG: thymidylate synthase [Planctomycetota bacterium]